MEKIRLQKYFSDCGILSRRAAEKEIEAGHVTVNGIPARIGDKVDPRTDTVTYRGKAVQPRTSRRTYLMLNKPKGVLTSASDDRGRRCVTELLTGISARVYPVGRLDLYSEGLLLLTDDGELANALTHPSHSLPKYYCVRVVGSVSDEQLAALNAPMTIDGYALRPVKVKAGNCDGNSTLLFFTLNEGRNRQIRKMCEQVGLKVCKLSRYAIGNLQLGDLPAGKWRRLTDTEVAYLKKSCGQNGGN